MHMVIVIRRKMRKRHLALAALALTVLAVVILGSYMGPARARTSGRSAPTVATAIPAEVPGASTGTAVAPSGPAVSPPSAGPLWPKMVSGRVLDNERHPVAGASLVIEGKELRTAEDGGFTIEPTGDGPLLVKVPGYRKVTIPPTSDPIEVVLRPQSIKGAYLTYYGVLDRSIRTRVLELVSRSELNAVIIDVKGDRGWITYKTEVPLALSVGAQGPAVFRDVEGFLAELRAQNVYTIARIVTFKDNVLATSKPEWAIIDTRTGRPWIDNEKLAWVDPFREGVWDYNIAIAQEAVRKGFDEVQFDYVRFPTDGRLSAARYSKVNSKDTRLPTIAGFLGRARQTLGPMGAFVGADVFGYTAFNENDTDIGQRIEELAPHLDFICPMVYPSGYHLGIPGYRNPVANPYHVVFESVRLIKKRSSGTSVRVRPWIQDFRDYAFDKRIFGPGEVRAQIKGVDDAGGAGWMLWNPRNDYTASALRAKEKPPVQ